MYAACRITIAFHPIFTECSSVIKLRFNNFRTVEDLQFTLLKWLVFLSLFQRKVCIQKRPSRTAAQQLQNN